MRPGDEDRMWTRSRRRTPVAASLALVGMLTAIGCTGETGTNLASPVRTSTASASPATIPQPTVTGLSVAPDTERVDLAMPTFSHPTNVTNPLFPISLQESVLLLGTVDGKAFRTEVTLLPETRIIEWAGQPVEVLVSQYVAYLDGRLHEVAYDLYAQDDTGAVWYFGEDVFNFAGGAIADTHGTWIAGKDGPAAMIMPADPQVGDVYRPENIPGLVFEEVTVMSVDQLLEGPVGTIEGGLVIEELHMDGFTEGKSFAPGYGEFFTGGGGDVEALTLAVPTDALPGSVPPELERMTGGALSVFEAVASSRWDLASSSLADVTAAWDHYRSGDVPSRIESRLNRALAATASAVGSKDGAGAQQAAIDVAMYAFDLHLPFRPAVEVDLARFDLWLAQMQVDAAAGDGAAVNGDFFALDYVRDRVVQALSAEEAAAINLQLEELLGAVGDGKLRSVARIAGGLRDMVATAAPAS